tara:strand:+ start:14270 stop:14782 length:513 start_codon:yes stop_codon:yes gene_type:complete
MEKKICTICSNKEISENLYCFECKNAICIECCNNLSSRSSLIYEKRKQMFIKYECPYCRTYNNRHIKLFNRKELVEFYIYISLCYLNLYNLYNDKNKELLKLKLENIKLKKNILDSKIEIDLVKKIKLENEELMKSVKKVIEINKTNSKLFDDLLEKYKNILNKNSYNKI